MLLPIDKSLQILKRNYSNLKYSNLHTVILFIQINYLILNIQMYPLNLVKISMSLGQFPQHLKKYRNSVKIKILKSIISAKIK